MNIPNELLEIRKQIDALDEQIVPLLVARTNLALSASDYKATEKQVRGDDGNRVNEVLERVVSKADEHKASIKVIYAAMIAELTELQLKKKGF